MQDKFDKFKTALGLRMLTFVKPEAFPVLARGELHRWVLRSDIDTLLRILDKCQPHNIRNKLDFFYGYRSRLAGTLRP